MSKHCYVRLRLEGTASLREVWRVPHGERPGLADATQRPDQGRSSMSWW
ncbi:MAG: hypothetical protein WDA11_01000 [Thiohalomonadaceae bacterium]